MKGALGTASQLPADLRDEVFRAGHLMSSLGLDIALLDIALVDRLVPLVLGRLGVEDRRLGVVFDSLGGKRIDVAGIPPHCSVDNVVGKRAAIRDVLIEALVGRVGNHAPELLVRDIALVADPELAIGPAGHDIAIRESSVSAMT